MQKLRNFLITSLIIILLFNMTSAQTETKKTNENPTPKISIGDPTPKLDEKIDKEIKIPQFLHIISKVGLGINPLENIKISKLITLIALWILVLVIALSALKSVPSLNTLTLWISSISITMIIGSTKALS